MSVDLIREFVTTALSEIKFDRNRWKKIRDLSKTGEMGIIMKKIIKLWKETYHPQDKINRALENHVREFLRARLRGYGFGPNAFRGANKSVPIAKLAKSIEENLARIQAGEFSSGYAY